VNAIQLLASSSGNSTSNISIVQDALVARTDTECIRLLHDCGLHSRCVDRAECRRLASKPVGGARAAQCSGV